MKLSIANVADPAPARRTSPDCFIVSVADGDAVTSATARLLRGNVVVLRILPVADDPGETLNRNRADEFAMRKLGVQCIRIPFGQGLQSPGSQNLTDQLGLHFAGAKEVWLPVELQGQAIDRDLQPLLAAAVQESGLKITLYGPENLPQPMVAQTAYQFGAVGLKEQRLDLDEAMLGIKRTATKRYSQGSSPVSTTEVSWEVSLETPE